MVEGMGEQVARPLGHHDGDHDEQELVDVVRDLHHDDGERHRESGHAREEGDRAQQGEGTCDEKFFV